MEENHTVSTMQIKTMHAPAGPQTTGESAAEDDLFPAMLAELKAIRKALEDRG